MQYKDYQYNFHKVAEGIVIEHNRQDDFGDTRMLCICGEPVILEHGKLRSTSNFNSQLKN